MVLSRAKTLKILMEFSLSIFSFRDQGLVSNLRTLQRCKRSSPFLLKVFVVPYFTLETILVICFESAFVLGVRLRSRFFFFLRIFPQSGMCGVLICSMNQKCFPMKTLEIERTIYFLEIIFYLFSRDRKN